MNKLEKILAQSVTPEMVAEQLTESEIEEVIEEYETKIANESDDIWELKNEVEEKQKEIESYKDTIADKIERVKHWENAVIMLELALEKKKGNQSDGCLERNESGHVWYHKNTGDPLYTNSNKCRAKLIEEAKEYIKDHKYSLEAMLDRADRIVIVHDYRAVNKRYIYPPHLTWNKHIAKAWGMAKFNTDDELIYKFGIDAPQPTEIVEGMDVITYEPDESIHMEGIVKRVSEKFSDLIFYDDKLYKENGYPHAIATSIRFGFTITDDTKAKYKEDEK